ncbi:MAG: MBL fold metallo-hydrolase [Crocinitomicaceae bacterium]
MEVTFLGTGTSQGVPVIACECEVCQSHDTKDKRLRTSIIMSIDDVNIVVDTGPDFRQQMLRENVKHIEAVLYTHEHKDHISGMDDIRAFNFKTKKPVGIYASEGTEIGLRKEYHYVFTDKPYPGVPQVNLHRIDSRPFKVKGIEVIPIDVMHYKLPVKAFRVKDFTYITDANTIAPSGMNKVHGTEVLVINALRKTPHLSHFTLYEALEIIETIGPKRAYLTHLSHLMGKHEDIQKELPDNVFVAYDGLKIQI